MVLVLPFAKILATSLSIGSGGSGGIFGPGMFIGGMLGAGIWRLLEPIAPAIPVDPAPFVIVAMMALFGSVAHAPLAVMLMVAEMTGNLSMLAPGDGRGRPGDVRCRVQVDLPQPARDAGRLAGPPVPLRDAPARGGAGRRRGPSGTRGRASRRHGAAARARMEAIGVPGAPVVGADGTVQGVIDLAALRLPGHERSAVRRSSVNRSWPQTTASMTP